MSVIAVPNLRHVTDDELGLGRRRAGRGFRYIDSDGAPIRDTETLRRIRALAIPPAWTDVWICESPNGYIQAIGRDARGRKQYRYHPHWRAFRDEVKFDRVSDFGSVLPQIRRRVAADLGRTGLDRDKVLALVVRLLETTLVRIGNEEYARDNSSYGLTTLRNSHVKGSASEMRLVFKGKSGKPHEVEITDRRVARVVRACRDLPGQQLFEYRNEDGNLEKLQSGDVNDYLREISGIDITAKDFRTWSASCLAASTLAARPAPTDETERREALSAMAQQVSAQLRNTPAVCRASYIHPRVIDAYERGALAARWSRAQPRGPRGLRADERRLLALLSSKQRTRSAAKTPSRRRTDLAA